MLSKEKVSFTCQYCGKIKYVYPCYAKIRKYCSNACKYANGLSEEAIKKMKTNLPDRHGKHHPMFGKHHSEKTKIKMSKAKLGKTGDKCPNWINGMTKERGRLQIWIKNERICNSRYVTEQCLGRKLLKEEIIHHINGVIDDDRPENLYLFPNIAEHMKHHGWKITPVLVSNITV